MPQKEDLEKILSKEGNALMMSRLEVPFPSGVSVFAF
jgi:hypothetical protein